MSKNSSEFIKAHRLDQDRFIGHVNKNLVHPSSKRRQPPPPHIRPPREIDLLPFFNKKLCVKGFLCSSDSLLKSIFKPFTLCFNINIIKYNKNATG